MTYDVYAMFREGSYLVASSNNADHGEALAERICVQLDEYPIAFATLTRGEHTLKGNVFTFAELKARSK